MEDPSVVVLSSTGAVLVVDGAWAVVEGACAVVAEVSGLLESPQPTIIATSSNSAAAVATGRRNLDVLDLIGPPGVFG